MPEMDLQSTFIEDKSFDVSGRSFSQPAPHLDESLRDRSLDDSIPDDVPVTFNVVEGGTKRGGQKLVSSDSYTYTRRNVKDGRVYWTCGIRNKNFKCVASVKQYGDLFTPSLNGHQHPAEPGALKKVTIAAKHRGRDGRSPNQTCIGPSTDEVTQSTLRQTPYCIVY